MRNKQARAVGKEGRLAGYWLSGYFGGKRVNLIIAALVGCLVFPNYAQSAPLKDVIHGLIDQCLHDPDSPFHIEDFDVEDFKYENPNVLPIHKIAKMNGWEYKAFYHVNFIYRSKNQPRAEWHGDTLEFQVELKDSVLDFSSVHGWGVNSTNKTKCHYTKDMHKPNNPIRNLEYEKKTKLKNHCISGGQFTVRELTNQFSGSLVTGMPDAISTKDNECHIKYSYYKDMYPPQFADLPLADLEIYGDTPQPENKSPPSSESTTEPKPEWIYLKTNVAVPYVPLTEDQWKEVLNLPFHALPSEEIRERILDTRNSSLEKLSEGTAYEACYHKLGVASETNICMLWSNPQGKSYVAVPVTITSGEHKGKKALITGGEYGSNFRQGKRITAD